jgi:hypothetical protein
MSIVRVGTTQKYAEGWEAIFGKSRKSSTKKTSASARKGRRKATGRRRK